MNDWYIPLKIKFTISTINVDTKDASEGYFEIKIIIIQVKIKTIASIKFMANNIPKYVATPFPPLNFNQIGNKCPIKVNDADKIR